MFAQTLFIVWRESIEALLVIGILHAWLAHNAEGRVGLRYLWAGVASGLLAAIGLAVLLIRFNQSLAPEAQEYFQAVLIFLACGLIVQMVFWMRRHGRTMKKDFEAGLSESVRRRQWWSIYAIALVAVAREASEAVIFLQGVTAAADMAGLSGIASGVVIALAAAAFTYALLQLGSRYLSWRFFFRGTEIMLLMLASALLVSGVGHLVSFGLLPYMEPLWDTGFVLDDMSRFGGLVAGLSGYRSQPDLVVVATWIVYWSAIAAAFRIQARPARARNLASK